MQKAKPGYKLVKWLFGKEIEIPEEWEVKKCSEILDLRHGFQFRDKDFISENKGIKIIKIGNLQQNGGFDTKKCDLISSDRESEFNNIIINSGDILMALTGATLGKTILVDRVDEKLLQNYRVGNFFPTNNIDKNFLYYSLKNSFTQKQIWFLVNSNAQPNIGKEDFDKIKIMVPTYIEQQKIASILTNINCILKSYYNSIDSTKKLKKGLMQQLLTKGIGHKKFKKIPWYFGKEIEIPEEWKVINLGKLCEIRKDGKTKSDLYVGLENIAKGNNKLVSKGNVKEFLSTKNIFLKGDVLYGKLRPILNKVWLATENGSCSTDILPLMTNEKLSNRMLLFKLSHNDFYSYAVGTSAGTKMPRTNWVDIQKFLIYAPNIKEQEQIVTILSKVDKKINDLELKKNKIENLKQGLMQKLLTGQIRVKV